jgi:hypothetical protein
MMKCITSLNSSFVTSSHLSSCDFFFSATDELAEVGAQGQHLGARLVRHALDAVKSNLDALLKLALRCVTRTPRQESCQALVASSCPFRRVASVSALRSSFSFFHRVPRLKNQSVNQFTVSLSSSTTRASRRRASAAVKCSATILREPHAAHSERMEC